MVRARYVRDKFRAKLELGLGSELGFEIRSGLGQDWS